jgi:hypothetical protein
MANPAIQEKRAVLGNKITAELGLKVDPIELFRMDYKLLFHNVLKLGRYGVKLDHFGVN